MKDLKLSMLLVLSMGLIFFTSCGEEDPVVTTGDAPISSFQFEVDAEDFLKVNFSNFSQNATSYTWDFGDGNMSSDENPSHTYAGGGDYDVSLEASNGTESRSSTKSISIVDPNTAIKKITGETSKVWKLSRNIADEEYPILVQPNNLSEIWWALGLNDPIGSRPCLMEEEYIFNIDGSYTYNSNGEVFADYGTWNADVEGQCVNDTDPGMMIGVGGENLLPWGGGTFTFDFDSNANTLSVNGLGAHIGLPKVGTDGEYNQPQAGVTYRIVSLETDGPVDKMVLETSLVAADGRWQFSLVSYDNPADEPDLPGAAPTTTFTYELDGSTVTFNNNSVNAESYSWDFGDGNGSSEENPIHTYAGDGTYTVKLVATNAEGSGEFSENIIIANNSVFDVNTLFGDDSKIWKLNPAAGALAVGPSIGSAEWWSNSEEDVAGRDCTFDDEYIFNNVAGFEYAAKGSVWAEAYMGVDPAGCVAEDALSSEYAAWGSGMHSYGVSVGSGGDPSFVTVTGTGAFIGLPKAYNGGEYAGAAPTVDGSVRYQVLSYIKQGDKETLVLTLDISAGEMQGGYWTFTLVSE